MSRQTLVRFVNAFCSVLVSPLYLIHALECSLTGKSLSFKSMAQFLALFPGHAGSLLRVAFLRAVMKDGHHDFHVDFLTTFVTHEVRIGRKVYIGAYCNIGLADIGDDTLIGTHVMITSGRTTHFFGDATTPIRLQGGRDACVSIGRDCWIANGAIVMADVGEGCVVAAGSVVVEPLPPYSIAGGVPAKVLGKRGEQKVRETS